MEPSLDSVYENSMFIEFEKIIRALSQINLNNNNKNDLQEIFCMCARYVKEYKTKVLYSRITTRLINLPGTEFGSICDRIINSTLLLIDYINNTYTDDSSSNQKNDSVNDVYFFSDKDI